MTKEDAIKILTDAWYLNRHQDETDKSSPYTHEVLGVLGTDIVYVNATHIVFNLMVCGEVNTTFQQDFENLEGQKITGCLGVPELNL